MNEMQGPGEEDKLKLEAATSALLDECRMVLPGIQALFGFQLIAVFNQGFAEKLTHFEQELHLAAIGLVVLAIALVMTPAALHRQTGVRHTSDGLLRVASRLLLLSMAPLAAAICLDVYLVGAVITHYTAAGVVIAAILFAFLLFFWYAIPHLQSIRRQTGEGA